MITVKNMLTGDVMTFTCSPIEAVVSAYALEHGDANTWEYDRRYRSAVETGRWFYFLGNWATKKG